MDLYKDRANSLKLMNEIERLIKEEDEALVTLKQQSDMHTKSFVCHFVLLALLLVVGMCSFTFVAYYGFQSMGYDQQSLNGGLLILLFTQVHRDANLKI